MKRSSDASSSQPLKHLAHLEVGPSNGRPSRTAFVLHGILGSGRNWRVFARRLAEKVPEWRFVLVDLRNHGGSQGFEPPHTLGACAADLDRLAGRLGMAPDVVLGHSFGAKVALTFARDFSRGLRAVFVLDANPGTTGDNPARRTTLDFVRTLGRIPMPIARRDDLVDALVERGHTRGVAGWMTTNLERTPAGFRWKLDLEIVESMLNDFFREDLWPVVESPGPAFRFVRGARSDVLGSEDLARIDSLSRSLEVSVEILPRSGHFLHVDNPDGLLRILGAGLSQISGI